MVDIISQRMFTITLSQTEWHGLLRFIRTNVEHHVDLQQPGVTIYTPQLLEDMFGISAVGADGIRALLRYDQSTDWQGD